MKKFVIITLVVLHSLMEVMAQAPADRIASDVQSMAQQCEVLSAEECVAQALEWVASIPSTDVLAYASQAQKLLYPPYSTLNKRIAYRLLLERLLQSGGDDVALLRYRYMYESLCRNNEGDEATDFVYYDADGNEHTLQSHRGQKTLIIFNDPECEECAALRRHIANKQELQGMPIDEATTVLVIYPDEPTDTWREAVSHYPESWIVGYSEDVSDVYDLRTLPSTYMLDENHHIVLRDAHMYITIE